jgi:hypothetical protein
MPIDFLSDEERARLSTFPEEVTDRDVIAYFRLTANDRKQLPRTTAKHNRFGYAMQLCTLRFLGFCPDDLTAAPQNVRPLK